MAWLLWLLAAAVLFTIVVIVGLCLTGILWRENSWLNRRRAD